MTQMMSPVDSCLYLFKEAKNRVAEGMPLLHRIFKEGLWASQYSSFGEFADDLGISRSYASRLITVWEHYAIQGGVSQLNEVDPDRLYLAMSLDGTSEEQLEKARLLTREELKSEKSMKGDGSEHSHEPITICKICGKRL